jgi:sulfopyruvate decarboxylase subunit alpha
LNSAVFRRLNRRAAGAGMPASPGSPAPARRRLTGRDHPDTVRPSFPLTRRSVEVSSGEQVATLLEELGVTHVVTVPDSTIGRWESAIERSERVRLVRVCREGEAWQVAAGLHLGGATPLVMIQCTGLFESGDALRNVMHDWKIPVFSIIGYRSYLDQAKLPGDTCLVFTEPILEAWRIDYRLITRPAQLDDIAAHFRACRSAERPGAALIAE